MKKEKLTVTISGPAASGKGTLARMLACKLNAVYIDAGWIFRYAAYCLREGRIKNPIHLLKRDHCRDWQYVWDGQDRFIIHDGRCLDKELMDSGLALFTAQLASNEHLFAGMACLVNKIVSHYSRLTIDGRSAGTVFCPDAEVKFYLTAPEGVRAERRRRDLLRAGYATSYDDVLGDIRLRDKIDSERLYDPLRIPTGAVVMDSGLATGPEEMLLRMVEFIKTR